MPYCSPTVCHVWDWGAPFTGEWVRLWSWLSDEEWAVIGILWVENRGWRGKNEGRRSPWGEEGKGKHYWVRPPSVMGKMGREYSGEQHRWNSQVGVGPGELERWRKTGARWSGWWHVMGQGSDLPTFCGHWLLRLATTIFGSHSWSSTVTSLGVI